MLLSYGDRNLILTGYTGPNQPIIGRHAAERLKLRYVNVEMQIEAREGMSSEDLRTRYGDARLKMVESEVMQDVLLNRFGKHYAAVGGKEVSAHIVVSGQAGHQRR